MNYIKKFKEIHQFQFGNVVTNDFQDKNIMKNFQEINDELNNESNDLIMEKYSSILIDNQIELGIFLEKVYKEIYNEYKYTQLQLVFNTSIGVLNKGSYCVRYPKIYETGYYESEISKFFKKNEFAMIIIYTDLQHINCIGKTGYAKALKQVGEIRQILKNSISYQIEIKDDINYNALSHAIGINVNSLLPLDVIVLKKNT